MSKKRYEDIAIIDEQEWDKSQKIRESRIPNMYNEENMDYESYHLSTKSDSLFIGFIKCGYCGSKMNGSSTTKKRTLANGTIKYDKKQEYYRCVNKKL